MSLQTTGGFLSLILGLVLPLAYGFQPDMVLMALGPAHGLQNAQAALLAAMLRSPVGGRILAVVEEVNWVGWLRYMGGRWAETTVSLRRPNPTLSEPGIHTPACKEPGAGIAWRNTSQSGSFLEGHSRGDPGSDVSKSSAGGSLEVAAGGW